MYLKGSYGQGLNTLSWSQEKKECDFGGSWLAAEHEYNTLKSFVLDNSDNVNKFRQAALETKKKKEAEASDKYDKIRSEGRVYASLVMDTSKKYNKEALSKLKQNNDVFSGMKLRYNTDQSGLINKITLKSPTDNLLSITLSYAFGQKPDNVWSLEKIEEIVNKIKKKYQKVDSKEEVQEHDLDTVQSAILRYHNSRKQPSQAHYNEDIKNAAAIKNLKSVFIFDNKGDSIIVTVKACIEGNGNTTPELLLYGDIYQNSLTIEYKSKNLVKLENKNRDAQLRKERAKEKKEASEMESL